MQLNETMQRGVHRYDAAVFGLGLMGETHVRAALDSPYIERVYGVDDTPSSTLRLTKKLHVEAASAEAVLADPRVELVYIATPNATHVALAEAALRAGKKVLVEKPMGVTLSEAEHLLAVRDEMRGWLQIGFELRYSKMYCQVKKWIDEGMLGTPLFCGCRYYCHEAHDPDEWRCKGEKSYLIGEKLSHYLDLQRWWFAGPVESVYSVNAPKLISYFHHPDNHQITVKFTNGGVGTLNFLMYFGKSWDGSDPLRDILEEQSDDGHFLQYHLTGTRGGIETDVFRRRMRRWEYRMNGTGTKSFQCLLAETLTFEKTEDQAYFHNVYGQNLRIAELAAKNLPPDVPAENALATMKLCFAAEESETTGQLIKMNEKGVYR